jgi:hypothetical protein
MPGFKLVNYQGFRGKGISENVRFRTIGRSVSFRANPGGDQGLGLRYKHLYMEDVYFSFIRTAQEIFVNSLG